MENDPGQFTNLAGNEEVAAEQLMMTTLLREKMAAVVEKE
jgi:hypothetical protein